MQAGKLRHRIELQTSTDSQNATGENIQSWAKTADLWASIEDLSGRELLLAQQVEAEVTTRVVIRYRAGVTAKQRIVSGSRTLEIESVIDSEGRERRLELLCKELP